MTLFIRAKNTTKGRLSQTESFREYYDFMFSQYQKYLQIEIDKQEKIGQEKGLPFKFGRNK